MFVLFDIGGTKMRLAISRDGKGFEEPLVRETPNDFEEGMRTLKAAMEELCGGEAIAAAAGGVPGPLNDHKDTLVSSPHKSGWVGKPIKSELERICNAPVYLENDSALVGLGEAHHGAGKGHNVVAYITVSTGVGGARIVNGRIDVHRYGFEPGHQIIDLDGTACPSCELPGEHNANGRGHLEGYVSGTATEHRFGVKPYEVTDEEAWDQIARWLAVGLNNTIVHWSPDTVVLGGSMVVKKPGIAVADVRKHLKDLLRIFPHHPEILEATLGDFGGLYGALVFVGQNHRTR